MDEKGTTVFWRPAVPLLFNQPVFDASKSDFGDASFGVGDIGFDLALGRTEKSGFIWAFGTLVTLPTATNKDIAGKQWRMGPEVLLGQVYKNGVLAIFPSHQWNVAGWDDSDYSVTTIQAGGSYFLGNGMTVGSFPKMLYNWKTGDWTIPINFNISKTVAGGPVPIKYTLNLDYYLQQPDAIGPHFMVRFTITPVVPNPLAGLFGGG